MTLISMHVTPHTMQHSAIQSINVVIVIINTKLYLLPSAMEGLSDHYWCKCTETQQISSINSGREYTRIVPNCSFTEDYN